MRQPSGKASDSRVRGWGFDPHSGRSVVSMSKIHLSPKSTGYTQEAVAPSRHDLKIVYWDFKQKRNKIFIQEDNRLPCPVRILYEHGMTTLSQIFFAFETFSI